MREGSTRERCILSEIEEWETDLLGALELGKLASAVDADTSTEDLDLVGVHRC